MTRLDMPLPFLPFSPLSAAFLAAAQFQAELAVKLQIEGLTFMRDRIESDVKCMTALTAAQADGDALAVLNDFSEAMVMDYTRETSRMFAIVAESAEDAATLARREALRAIDNIAARSIAP
jgi:hypothetical protein